MNLDLTWRTSWWTIISVAMFQYRILTYTHRYKAIYNIIAHEYLFKIIPHLPDLCLCWENVALSDNNFIRFTSIKIARPINRDGILNLRPPYIKSMGAKRERAFICIISRNFFNYEQSGILMDFNFRDYAQKWQIAFRLTGWQHTMHKQFRKISIRLLRHFTEWSFTTRYVLLIILLSYRGLSCQFLMKFAWKYGDMFCKCRVQLYRSADFSDSRKNGFTYLARHREHARAREIDGA